MLIILDQNRLRRYVNAIQVSLQVTLSVCKHFYRTLIVLLNNHSEYFSLFLIHIIRFKLLHV